MPNTYDRFLSRRAKRRKASAIQELMPLAQTPGIISMAPGVVDTATFPFRQLLEVGLDNENPLRVEGDELYRALGYTSSYGYPPFLEQLWQRTVTDHKPPYAEGELRQIVACGGHDLLAKAFDMLIDEDDPVLVEAPTFSGALAALIPQAPRLVGVPCHDRTGIDADKLREILEQYKGAERRPRMLYTIPTGQNPTGATASTETKRAVYALACEYDLLILEDDPYYYLYFEDSPQPASYLSIDTEHRVLRLDSLSKVLCPGLRIGWATGPSFLVERLQLDMQASSMNPSVLSQVLAMKLMIQWGDAGWRRHVEKLKDTYRKKRDSFQVAAAKHLTGLAEWNHPAAGMFVWIRLLGDKIDARRLMEEKAAERKVLFVPGEFFLPSNEDDPQHGQGSPFLRASYSLVPPEEMDTGLSRLADMLREHQEQQIITNA